MDEPEKSRVLARGQTIITLKKFYSKINEVADMTVDVYLVESTGKKTKDPRTWFRTHNLILPTSYRRKIVKLFNQKFLRVINKISKDDTDFTNFFDYNRPFSGGVVRYIEPHHVPGFGVIWNQIKQGGSKSSTSAKGVKSIVGYVLDIQFKDGGRVAFFVKNRRSFILKKNSIMVGLFKRRLSLATDDYTSIPLAIDSIYFEFPSNEDSDGWLLVLNTRYFESFFKYYEHYKQITQETISKLKDSGFIEFENEEKVMKYALSTVTIFRTLTQLQKTKFFSFITDGGIDTGSERYRNFVNDLLDQLEVLSAKERPNLKVTEDGEHIKIKIEDKKGLKQFIEICQRKYIASVGKRSGVVRLYEVKGGVRELKQVPLDAWLRAKPEGETA
ncbi:Kiwa anti-phage protein KwaB-like domain-containing protein [Thermococcus sp.]|uniref:Kiwa anti-phage protein KwaB-like domain-containing protein n=1 Tax=Thermococcus sp. TaxID=35749 RepID=UPI0026227570|nr:Kiwa anti-phage protein KwaB-like domain-containing protein [Thermococcus sp.]